MVDQAAVSVETEKAEVCPRCGSLVEMNWDCPGWIEHGEECFCSPSCSKVRFWSCTNVSCTWWYGESSRSFFNTGERGEKPSWL